MRNRTLSNHNMAHYQVIIILEWVKFSSTPKNLI